MPFARAKIEGLVDPKSLGAFYTPSVVAEVLAEWVVRSGTERLLEPSVGDGALVKAAVARARSVGHGDCGLRILACDVDQNALRGIAGGLPLGSAVHATDFLQLDPGTTGEFDGVLANPPFTRNHALEPNRRRSLRERFDVSGAAGLWVYFLLHSLGFLSKGGRLACSSPRISSCSQTMVATCSGASADAIRTDGVPEDSRQDSMGKRRRRTRSPCVRLLGIWQGCSPFPQALSWSSEDEASET